MHKQRLAVLLFLGSVMYGSLYLMYFIKPELSFLVDFSLLQISSATLNVALIFDKVSLSFSALVTFIAGCVFLFARTYMSNDQFYYRFMWTLLSFVLSMNMLILSGSFLTLLVGWDGLGVSSFALIIYYQSKESWTAGFLTLLINRLGDVAIMSLLFLFASAGMSLVIYYPMEYRYLMLFLLAGAALTKSAQYPFSVWLPAAMAAPTPVSALVHSSTLVTAGIYIIIRASISMPLPTDVMTLLLFCGSLTSMVGGMCAIVENDIKKIVALSTLSQLGVMVFSLGLGANSLALLHLYAHAMFKALLFLVAGAVLLTSYGVQDIRLLGGVTRKAPILLVFMNISTFCLMGLPFMSAFYSKHVILSLMWNNYPNLLAVLMMLISTGLTGLYMIRFTKCMNWGSTMSSITSQTVETWLFYVPMCLLFSGSLTCGMLFYSVDSVLPMSLYLPSNNDLLLNFITLFGVILGCMYINRHRATPLSTMFYLVPTWYKSNMLYFKMSTKVKWLDQGWLEPNGLGVVTRKSSFKFYNISCWPVNSLSILPFTFMFFGLSGFVWVCLK